MSFITMHIAIIFQIKMLIWKLYVSNILRIVFKIEWENMGKKGTKF